MGSIAGVGLVGVNEGWGRLLGLRIREVEVKVENI